MIRILGKMDLGLIKERGPQIDFNKISKFLFAELESSSNAINNEYGDFLEKDATVKIETESLRDVLQKEFVWARSEGLISPDLENSMKEWISSQESCLENLENINKALRPWRDKRDKKQSNISEMLFSYLMRESLGDEFLVVRASYYDDYENGVDYILLDKETGAVVCGIDQVWGRGADDGAGKKDEKMKSKMLAGGAKLKYGLSFDEKNSLCKKELKNIPVFFLGISNDDLLKALSFLQKNNDFQDKEFKDFSKSLLAKTISSLDQQFDESLRIIELERRNNKNQNLEKVLNNLQKSKPMLDKISKLIC